MVSFDFDPLLSENETIIDGGTEGKIIVTADTGAETVQTSSRPFFLLYSVLDLMGGLLQFLQQTRTKIHVFSDVEGICHLRFERRRGGRIAILLTDTQKVIGECSPKELRDSIWEAFQRLDSDPRLLQPGSQTAMAWEDHTDEWQATKDAWTTGFPDLVERE